MGFEWSRFFFDGLSFDFLGLFSLLLFSFDFGELLLLAHDGLLSPAHPPAPLDPAELLDHA
jgi:hypothetical protein